MSGVQSSRFFIQRPWGRRPNRLLRVCVTVGALLCLATLGTADEVSMSAAFKRFMAAPDNPIILRGDYLKAAQVAYQDFSKILSQKSEDARTGRAGDPALSDKLSKLENYDVSIDQTPTTFVVQFGPTVRDKGLDVSGGGASYIVDRSTFALKQKTMLK